MERAEDGRDSGDETLGRGLTEPEAISAVGPALAGPEVASQRWSALTFLHWRVPAATIAPLLPDGITPDEHDGSSWVGLIAFYLDRATLGRGPVIPFIGAFTEVNVRLYGVDELGRRGVVFVSLEASRLAAVLAARAKFSLPYFWARTAMRELGGVTEYTSSRHRERGGTKIVVRPSESPVVDDPTAEFLTARWGVFVARRGKTIFLPDAHEPWVLFEAELITLEDSLLELAGLSGFASRAPDSVLYSPGVTAHFGEPS